MTNIFFLLGLIEKNKEIGHDTAKSNEHCHIMSILKNIHCKISEIVLAITNVIISYKNDLNILNNKRLRHM